MFRLISRFFLKFKLKNLSKKIKRELKLYRLVLKDRDTPFIAKFLLGLMLAYAVSPIDLIPDFIPVLGYLDDLVVLPLLLFLALKFIPQAIIVKYKRELNYNK